jgi:cardiolipin synthase
MQTFKELIEWFYVYWVSATIVLHISLSILTSIHIIMFKENERTSLAWIGLVILSPIIGSMFYWIFGINRIKRLAQKEHPQIVKNTLRHREASIKFFNTPKHWHSAIIAGYNIHPVNHIAGNAIEPLINGDTAYPLMIQAINNAQHFVVLSSYIFYYDALGRQFVHALSQAQQRGVTVKVLLDGIGAGYNWHKSGRALQKLGVETARFLPAFSLTSIRFINLRNHRKILCIDGEVAYIGGMNLSKRNIVAATNNPIDDVHFKVTGPVIDQISQVFTEDWFFATGDLIQFPPYVPSNETQMNDASVVAKVVQDGPDEHHNRVRWTLIHALACAQESVKIITPYFIPDEVLMASLHAAALRGVSIEVIIPQHSNIVFVDWVMEANASRIITHGIRLYKSKRHFDHSKIMMVDNEWSFIGSSNWDARSLEFNFEINIECFDTTLNQKLTALFSLKKQSAVEVTSADVNRIPAYKVFRNNLFRLFSPYL